MVSIVIPTYERYELVNRAIDSCLSQTYKEIEIIVVDDCSSDTRYNTLKENNKIKFIRLENKANLPSVVRNVGIKYSKGEWVAFLDDDDYFLPYKIEKQMSYTKNYDFICSDAYYDTQLSKRYARGLYESVWNNKNPKNIHDFDYNLISSHNLIINSSVLVKKKLLENINFIPENKEYRRIEDYKTWLSLLKNQTKYCRYIDQPLLYYNVDSFKF